MPIVVEHQPAGVAVGLAAYASGVGNARERWRKQMLDRLAEQQAQEREMDFRREMQEDRFEFEGMLAGERMASDEGLQEAMFRERREESDLDARRRRADWRRREAGSITEDSLLSDRNKERERQILDEIQEIDGDRYETPEDKQAAIEALQEERRRLHEESPRKPTLEEEIAERTKNYPDWMKDLPWNLKDGVLSLPSNMPDSPEELQRERDEKQRQAQYDEDIFQWEAAEKQWEDARDKRRRYEDWLWTLPKNEGASFDEIDAQVEERYGPLGDRPRPPRRTSMGPGAWSVTRGAAVAMAEGFGGFGPTRPQEGPEGAPPVEPEQVEPEQQDVNEVVPLSAEELRNRFRETNNAYRRPVTSSVTGTSQQAAPLTRAEYEALPSGAIFVDPNGVRRRKP